MNCTSLERINLPSTVTAIDDFAFCDCVSLREVELTGGIQRIGREAFRSCSSLERIKNPSTLTVIGAYAFDGCVSLREMRLFGGIQDIGAEAFVRCSSLGRITIPSKAFVITKMDEAYQNCCLLTDRTITLTDGTFTPTSRANRGHVLIASKCLKYMSVTGLAEVANRISAITNSRERTREENLERIHALFSCYMNWWKLQ